MNYYFNHWTEPEKQDNDKYEEYILYQAQEVHLKNECKYHVAQLNCHNGIRRKYPATFH